MAPLATRNLSTPSVVYMPQAEHHGSFARGLIIAVPIGVLLWSIIGFVVWMIV